MRSYTCLHYVLGACSTHLSSHCSAPNNKLKWCQISSCLFLSMHWFFSLLSKELIKNETMNAVDVTAIESQHIPPPYPSTCISHQFIIFRYRRVLPPTLPPVSITSFPFSTFLKNSTSDPLIFESSFTVNHNWLPQCQVICVVRPADCTTLTKLLQKIQAATGSDGCQKQKFIQSWEWG